MYRSLSLEYDRLYQEQLEAFQQRLVNTYPQHTGYTDFYPAIGVPAHAPVVDLLVYGQAVGGWQPNHDYAQPVPKSRTAQSREQSNGHYGTDSPLDWVNAMWSKSEHAQLEPARLDYYMKLGDYNPSRSFFWQVTTYFIQQKFNVEPSCWKWTEHLVWSNLYKIATQTDNPSEADRILQRPECVGLVRQELMELQPKYCLVLTNDAWWSHFRTGLPTELMAEINDEYIERVERFGPTTIVVVKRPRVGSYKKTVDRILSHLP